MPTEQREEGIWHPLYLSSPGTFRPEPDPETPLALSRARRAVPDAAAVAVPADVVRIRWMYEAVRGVAVDVEARAHFVERYQGQE